MVLSSPTSAKAATMPTSFLTEPSTRAHSFAQQVSYGTRVHTGDTRVGQDSERLPRHGCRGVESLAIAKLEYAREQFLRICLEARRVRETRRSPSNRFPLTNGRPSVAEL